METRREFFKSAAWMGAVAMAAGCANNPLKLFGTTGAPMQGFALKPMKKVRVACIGVGARGRAALRRISMIPGTEVAAIADLFQDRIDGELKWLRENGKPTPRFAKAGAKRVRPDCHSKLPQ